MLVLPDRPRALDQPDGRHPAQPDARPSRPPRHDAALRRRSRSGWSRAARRRSSASTTVYCAQIADRLERAGRQVIRISKRLPLTDGYFADGTDLMEAVHGRYSRIAFLEGIGSLRGQHNAQNALAAVAACLKVGLDLGEIQAGLESFPGLAHRMEQVGRKGHVLFVNDSKATNADAAAPALSSFQRIYWIAGGLPKEGGIEPLAPLLPAHRQGLSDRRGGAAFSATLGEAVPYEISGTLAAAVEHAAHDAAQGRQRRGGGAAVAGLRQLRPVQEFRSARRSLQASCACYRGRETHRRDTIMAQPSRQKSRRRLVVDGRPLVPGGVPVADGARHRAVLRRQPGGGRAHRPRQLPLRHAADRLHRSRRSA